MRRMERNEERKGVAMAAKEAREQGKAEALHILKEQTKVAMRADAAKTSPGQELEAREVPSGKETEEHVSGNQERQAVSGYFKKLEKSDKDKHTLAVSVIHKEEVPRPGEKAWADGTDRRDILRDNNFFDQIAEHDKEKAERARVKRIQDRKDKHSLSFLEAVDHTIEQAKAKAERKATTLVPRAFKEWEHAEATIGVDEDKKRNDGASQERSRVQRSRVFHSARHYKTPQQHPTAGGDKTGMRQADRQAISTPIQKDVAAEVDEAVVSGIKKVLHRRAGSGNRREIHTPASSPVVAVSQPHAGIVTMAAPKDAQSKDTKRDDRSGYEYQKKHLAHALDTPEPSAKKQLDNFLHNPVSSIESLF